MASQRKVLPARRPRTSQGGNSVFLRSARTIGRIIGTLQRQLDGARQRPSPDAGAAATAADPPRRLRRPPTGKVKKASRAGPKAKREAGSPRTRTSARGAPKAIRRTSKPR